MAINLSDMDKIFNSAGAVIDATQGVVSAVSNGINQVQNAFDDSRRNAPIYQNGGYAAYNQPVTYGYGYSEPDPRMQAPYSFVMTSNCSGYPPFYTTGGSNPYQQMNSYNQPNPYNQPIISGGGYYGFTDPGYGNMGNCVGYGGICSNGQKGGSFGWG